MRCKTDPLEEKETHEQGRRDPQIDQETAWSAQQQETHSTWEEMKPHRGGNCPHRGGSEDHMEVEETHSEVVEKDHYRGGEKISGFDSPIEDC